MNTPRPSFRLSREFRKYVYGVAIAAIPVLLYFEIIEPPAAGLVLPLLLAILNLTPRDVEEEIPDGSGRYRAQIDD